MELNKKPPSTLRLLFILIFAAMGCVGSVLLVADLQCASDIETWAPLYPSAETVSVDYDTFRARATGITRSVQISSDDLETVKEFYREVTLANLRDGKGRGLAATDWRAIENPNGEGTQVTLISTCGI